MVYVKQTWASLPTTTTPVSAERLNHIEDGILDASTKAETPTTYAEVTGKPVTFPPNTHTQSASTITDFAEAVDDRVNALLMPGTNVSITYNDVANTLTIASSGGGAGTVDAEGVRAVIAVALSGTSTTSNTLTVGTKTFTTQADKAWANGSRLRMVDTTSPTARWVEGVVTSYSGTTLQITVDRILGTGTLASWGIVVAGQPGIDGSSGFDLNLLPRINYNYLSATWPPRTIPAGYTGVYVEWNSRLQPGVPTPPASIDGDEWTEQTA